MGFRKKVEEVKQRKAIQIVLKHINENKAAYIAGTAATVGAVFTMLVMRSNTARGAVGETGARGALSNTASRIFMNKQIINVTTVVDRDGRGHPGWPVRNIETGKIFVSQRAAAEAFGIPPTALSGQLKGKFTDIDGLTFERVSFPS